jgi:hypothetical protein
MEQALPLLALVGFLVAWTWFLHRRSGGRQWSALWLAFSSTTGAVFFLTAGVLGYRLDRRARFFTSTAWSDTVIWWQIWIGVAMAVAALYFWRRALRGLRTPAGTPVRSAR